MCHATKSNNRTRFSTHYPFTYFDDERKSNIRPHFDRFDDKSRDWRTFLPVSLFLSHSFSLSLFLSLVRFVKRIPGNRRTGIRHCAPSKTPRKFVVKLARVRKKRGFTSTGTLSRYPFCSCFIFLFYFSRPRFEEMRANY